MSHMIEASRVATRHGESGKTSMPRYILRSAFMLAVLFGLFIIAGFEF